MESLGFANVDYATIESNLGLSKPFSSDPTTTRKPPHDPLLNAQIFSTSPPLPLTSSEWQDPQKLLILIRTFQVGVQKFCDNINSFNENCRTMKMNLDDEREVLSNLGIYGGLREVKVEIGRVGERIERREREREGVGKRYEEFVNAGREMMEGIMERGKEENRSWWMEKPWWERGEAYRSERFYEERYNRRRKRG